MVASVVRRPWYRFRANGAQVELAADPVQNESLEGVITTVLDVELASEITLATNVTADLYAIEQDAATITAQFAGTVNQIPGDSFPNRVGYLCNGPLSKTRRVTTSGRNLTGMTDGEAVQEILDSCNVPFDPADIQDAGYVLGAEFNVHWLKDQPGHEIIAELDSVFGMATIEVGAGRVVRFAYDRAPDAADISVTYTRGVDAKFWRNSRVRGDLDAIVNVVQVTGASWEDAAGCTRSPWSRGVADNAALGAGVRSRSMPFSSDFIQDEALAGAIAERLLRWYNRQPDTLTLVALNDQNVSPGDVIGVKDQAYGITLTADADATPYLVLTIVRRGDEMTLTCVGGAAGATGTITTGVEKVCNQTSSDVNIPGLFDPPAISLPPAIAIAAYDCGTDGGPNGLCQPGSDGCYDLLAEPYLSQWQPPDPALASWAISAGEIVIRSYVASSTPNRGFNSGVTIPKRQDWVITVAFQIHQTRAAIAAGLTQAPTSFDFMGALSGPAFGAIDEKSATVFGTNGGDAVTLAVDTTYSLSLSWDATAKELTMAGIGPSVVVPEDNGETLWTVNGFPFLLANLASGGNTGIDTLTVTQYELCINATPGGGIIGIVGDWEEDEPSFTWHVDSLEMDNLGGGHNTVVEVDPDVDWTLTATIETQDGCGFHLGISPNSAPVTGQWEVLVEGTSFFLQSPDDGDFASITPFDDDEPIDVVLTRDAGTGLFTATLTQGAQVESLDVTDPTAPGGTGPYRVFVLASGSGTGLLVTAIDLVVG